jgi:hypothetical protein
VGTDLAVVDVDGDDGCQSPPHLPNVDARVAVGGIEATGGQWSGSIVEEPGVDYDDTYTLVIHMEIMCKLLAYAVLHNLAVHLMDVISAHWAGNEDPGGVV